MFDRLLPVELLKHHVASLSDRSGPRGSAKPDWSAISVLIALPAAVGIGAWVSDVRLQQPGALLAALSLLSAGLLAAFGQIASIRSRYRLPDGDYDPEWRIRAMLDEAVAHILTAALIAVFLAAVIIIGMNAAPGTGAVLGCRSSVVVVTAGTYLGLVFLMVIRKLWGAYEVANERVEEREYLR